MPKIRDLIAAAEKDTSGAPYFAIEFFPPRTEEGVHKLRERFGRFKQQREWPGGAQRGRDGTARSCATHASVAHRKRRAPPALQTPCTPT